MVITTDTINRKGYKQNYDELDKKIDTILENWEKSNNKLDSIRIDYIVIGSFAISALVILILKLIMQTDIISLGKYSLSLSSVSILLYILAFVNPIIYFLFKAYFYRKNINNTRFLYSNAVKTRYKIQIVDIWGIIEDLCNGILVVTNGNKEYNAHETISWVLKTDSLKDETKKKVKSILNIRNKIVHRFGADFDTAQLRECLVNSMEIMKVLKKILNEYSEIKNSNR